MKPPPRVIDSMACFVKIAIKIYAYGGCGCKYLCNGHFCEDCCKTPLLYTGIYLTLLFEIFFVTGVPDLVHRGP